MLASLFLTLIMALSVEALANPRPPGRFPADKPRDVNPDTHLVLTFPSAPVLGPVRFWEHNSTHLSDGRPVDVSGRHPVSRQLTAEKDADTIARYRDPSYVLGGWKPAMAPVILKQPESVSVRSGVAATFRVQAATVTSTRATVTIQGR